MKRNIINYAGIILFYYENNIKKYLLIKNALTGSWDPLSCLKNDDESYLGCAIRDCFKETSIILRPNESFVFSPYEISFSIINNTLKKLLLFPIELDSFMSTKLSFRHIEYRWFKYSQLEDLYKKEVIEKNYLDIIANIERNITNKRELTNENIIEDIHSVLLTNDLLKEYNWHLSGSVAANEFTIQNDFFLSDIDLVAFGPKIPLRGEIKRNAEVMLAQAESIFPSYMVSNIGINYQLLDTRLNVADPFWSYFKSYSIPVSSNFKESLTFFEDYSLVDKGYNLFRLLWYTVLRSYFKTPSEKEYGFAKASILLFYFLFDSDSKFSGYSILKDKLVHILKYHNCKENERVFYALLDAFNFKLNRTNKLLIKDWENLFYDLFYLTLNKLNDREFILSRTILNIENGFFYHDAEFLRVSQDIFPYNESAFNKIYEYAIETNNKHIVWLLLLLIRIKTWPNHLQFSMHKYSLYLDYFYKNLSYENHSISHYKEMLSNALGILP